MYIEIKHLKKYFPLGGDKVLKAVDDVTLDVKKGEVLSVVGESGSGKTTFGRTLANLYKKNFGEIIIEGKKIEDFTNLELTKKIQMIFQDPQASLNPRMTVGEIISEGMVIHKMYKTNDEMREKVYELLELVGLNREHINRFPHEFSGGQRQRIGIARALALEPEILICDEPISALDVSIQAQVVNLLKDLQKEKGLTMIFIAHDLSMVKYISDRVAVMFRGKIVELGSPDEVYNNPQHIYTKSLISAVPIPDPEYVKSEKIVMDEKYLRSPIGTMSELKNIEENSGLIKLNDNHYVEKNYDKLLITFMMAFVIFSCGSSSANKQIVINLIEEGSTMDTTLMTSQVAGTISSFLNEGLTKVNPETKVVEPALAEKWEVSEDGLEWTIHLKDGLKWSEHLIQMLLLNMHICYFQLKMEKNLIQEKLVVMKLE